DISHDALGRPEIRDAAKHENYGNGNGHKQAWPVQGVLPPEQGPTETIDAPAHRIQRIEQPPLFGKNSTHKAHRGKVETKLHDEGNDESKIPILDHQRGNPETGAERRG